MEIDIDKGTLDELIESWFPEDFQKRLNAYAREKVMLLRELLEKHGLVGYFKKLDVGSGGIYESNHI